MSDEGEDIRLLRRYPDLHPAHYRVGAWAWILHRLTGLGIALYAVAHIITISYAVAGSRSFDRIMDFLHQPWALALELVLLGAILYHGANGLRIIIFDLGIASQHQKGIFWILMAIGGAFFLASLAVLLPSPPGKPLP